MAQNRECQWQFVLYLPLGDHRSRWPNPSDLCRGCHIISLLPRLSWPVRIIFLQLAGHRLVPLSWPAIARSFLILLMSNSSKYKTGLPHNLGWWWATELLLRQWKTSAVQHIVRGGRPSFEVKRRRIIAKYLISSSEELELRGASNRYFLPCISTTRPSPSETPMDVNCIRHLYTSRVYTGVSMKNTHGSILVVY
jgi:hypothetical protein